MEKEVKVVDRFVLTRHKERERDSWYRYDWKDEEGDIRFSFCMTLNHDLKGFQNPWCYMQLFSRKKGPKGDSVEICIHDDEIRTADGTEFRYSAIIFGHSAEGSAMTVEGIDSYIEELRLAQDVVRELDRRFFKDWAKEMAIADMVMPDEETIGDE